MSVQGERQLVLGWEGIEQPLHVEVSDAPLTSDAGLLVVRQFDEEVRLTERFAAALHDARDEPLHSVLSMVRQRIYGILADYEDQNDHDTLRSDPVFKLIANRRPDGHDLASQPTLSRFENAVSVRDLLRLRDVLCEQFLDSFESPPSRITLDLDAFDDPTHGEQQLRLFHGFYEQFQYLPIAITCAETDAVALVGLRHGTAHAALGADDDLRYLVSRIRARWPDVEIVIRADSGFGVPHMYEVCEELRLTYTFGFSMNPRLQRETEPLLAQAVAQHAAMGMKQRLFALLDYQAGTWPRPRTVIVKCEAHDVGTNRRAVVTNRPGAAVEPQATYDAYAERGESENRNKELKRELKADRLSDHRFMANFFRLYLHAAALNLLIGLRRRVADEYTPQQLGVLDELPPEALPERPRRRYYQRRRQRDPLGEGFACTWRTLLIKVAATVHVHVRRIVIRLSGSWPHQDSFARVIRRLQIPALE